MFDKEPKAIDSDVAPEGLMAFVLHMTKKRVKGTTHMHGTHNILSGMRGRILTCTY